MKNYKCEDCAREFSKEDDNVMAWCPCGGYAKLIKSSPLTNENSKDNQVILKEVFQIGVTKGKPLTMDEWLEDLDTKIKVNLK